MTRKLRRRPVRMYTVVADAVRSGVVLGWRRAHKHTDSPSEEHAAECIECAVMEMLIEAVQL